MSDDEFALASEIADLAERELAAYLWVVHECLGCRNSLQSGHVWIDTLESLEWPKRERERFFRRLTILSICQLVGHSVGRDPAKHLLFAAANMQREKEE
jgi:hypothetical protein